MGKRELLLRAVRACGFDELPRTHKYERFRRPDGRILLIGNSAGLRVTRSAIADSASLTGNRYYSALLEVGRLSSGYTSPEQARTDLACQHDRRGP